MTTCMVVTPLGRSPTVILESASVLLFSKILPACMSFTSFIDLGVIVLPVYAKKTPLKTWREEDQHRTYGLTIVLHSHWHTSYVHKSYN